MIKLFSVKVRCRAAVCPAGTAATSPPVWPPAVAIGAPASRCPHCCLQEKQKKDAAAAANGKAVKQVWHGVRRIHGLHMPCLPLHIVSTLPRCPSRCPPAHPPAIPPCAAVGG